MICLECGKRVRSINYQHLRSCSGVSPADYRKRHPDAALMDVDVRASISRPMESNPRWKGRSGRSCEVCGSGLSRRARGTRCKRCRDRSGGANPFFGKRHALATRSRMRDAAAGRDPSTYRGTRNPNPRLLSLRRKEEWARRSAEEKERHLAAFIVAGQRANRKGRGTRIEVEVARVLDELGVSYRQNVQIGRYNVDFTLGSTIIECFGDFWHCNPALWPADRFNGSLRMTAGEKWARDSERRRSLEEKGFRFALFWESDIRTAPHKIAEAIRELLSHRDGRDVPESE